MNQGRPGEIVAEDVAPAAAPPKRRRRAWDDSPLGEKVGLLVLAALVIGALIGATESRFGERTWPLVLGLCAAAWALIAMMRCWVLTPYEKLVHWLEVQARSAAPFALKNLPIHRRDEIGRIARAMHQISTTAIRNHYESRRLRRTLDSRIDVETAKVNEQLRDMAMRDGLTDLGNRRFLDHHLEALAGASAESGADLICTMIDLDHFKQVNDTLGHAEGDNLLVLVATLIRGSIRHNDVAVRFGGDEFAVFMPGATVERGKQFASSIRKLFLQQVKAACANEGLSPNLSIGVASMIHDDCGDGACLLNRADQYLYAAKNAGRGCTVATPLDD